MKFTGFIRKEFYHIFRDYRSLVILIGMPVIQILLFGYAITTDIKDARVAILDNSKDIASMKITDKLLSSGYFKLSENLSNLKDVERSFRKGKVKEVIIFESNFAEKLNKTGKAGIQIIADATDPNTASLLVSYTTAIITNYQSELSKDAKVPYRIEQNVRMMFNPEMKSVYMFIPGTMVIILMLVCAMMTSISITREKETGTMEVLLVSPLKPFHIIAGKVIPYIVLSFIDALVILSMGHFVFGLIIHGSLILLLAESILFVIMALSMGIMISTVAPSQQVAMLLSLAGLMLPSILLSGFIFPIENMPVVLQWFCNIIPAKWFIIIIRSIILKGVGLKILWKETLILLLLTVFFVTVSVKRFKIRLE
jgi:ABC-2 type transport system permease protein